MQILSETVASRAAQEASVARAQRDRRDEEVVVVRKRRLVYDEDDNDNNGEDVAMEH